jgi:hypothetical protein
MRVRVPLRSSSPPPITTLSFWTALSSCSARWRLRLSIQQASAEPCDAAERDLVSEVFGQQHAGDHLVSQLPGVVSGEHLRHCPLSALPAHVCITPRAERACGQCQGTEKILAHCVCRQVPYCMLHVNSTKVHVVTHVCYCVSTVTMHVWVYNLTMVEGGDCGHCGVSLPSAAWCGHLLRCVAIKCCVVWACVRDCTFELWSQPL